jgi:GH18 family chitinase
MIMSEKSEKKFVDEIEPPYKTLLKDIRAQLDKLEVELSKAQPSDEELFVEVEGFLKAIDSALDEALVVTGEA